MYVAEIKPNRFDILVATDPAEGLNFTILVVLKWIFLRIDVEIFQSFCLISRSFLTFIYI